MTVVDAPPRRPPSQDELEALIEEARRRARRRRLIVGGAVVSVLAVAGLVAALVLVRRGGTSTAVPRGYRPWWYQEDPTPGTIVLTRSLLAFARDGVLETVAPTGAKFRLDRPTALALAKALRPVSGD